MRADVSDTFEGIQSAPPALVVSDRAEAGARAADLIASQGMRPIGPVCIADADERLRSQVSASAVWIELDAESDGQESLLSALPKILADRPFPMIVSVPARLIDDAAAHLLDADVEIVVEGSDAERSAALALATAAGRTRGR